MQQTTTTAPRRITTGRLVITALTAALLAIISQISLPMPTGVPITIQIYGVALIGILLGWRSAFWATVVYILLGAAGVPVFSNFRGGFYVLTSLTGGYILAWPLMVMLCGIRPHTGSKKTDTALTVLFCLLGLALDEFAGGLQWAMLSGEMTGWAVFTYSMTAFVPKDILLTLLAIFTGIPMRRLLRRAGVPV